MPGSHEIDEMAAILPTPFARAGGGVLLAAGLFSALLAAQASSMVRLRGLALAFVVLLGALGLLAIAFGWNVRRMRGWAALGGAVIAGVGGLVSGAWLVVSLGSGRLSLFALFVPVLHVAGALADPAMAGRPRDAREAPHGTGAMDP